MANSEKLNNAGTFVHEGLNVAGWAAEKPVKVILAATAVAVAYDISKNKSSLHTLIKFGAIMAAALKGISVVADMGVDAISRPDEPSQLL